MKGGLISLILAAALVLAISAAAAPTEVQVASCDPGPVIAGSGSADWRRDSLDAGPLGVRMNPLSQMSRTRNGQFVTKMPALVEGHAPVTLRVPPRLRHRVFLYYGFVEDRQGHRTTRISGAPGFSEIVFQPCADKPRTIWPGGIRIKGRKPVRLLVQVEARESIPLPLGKPTEYRSPAS